MLPKTCSEELWAVWTARPRTGFGELRYRALFAVAVASDEVARPITRCELGQTPLNAKRPIDRATAAALHPALVRRAEAAWAMLDDAGNPDNAAGDTDDDAAVLDELDRRDPALDIAEICKGQQHVAHNWRRHLRVDARRDSGIRVGRSRVICVGLVRYLCNMPLPNTIFTSIVVVGQIGFHRRGGEVLGLEAIATRTRRNPRRELPQDAPVGVDRPRRLAAEREEVLVDERLGWARGDEAHRRGHSSFPPRKTSVTSFRPSSRGIVPCSSHDSRSTYHLIDVGSSRNSHFGLTFLRRVTFTAARSVMERDPVVDTVQVYTRPRPACRLSQSRSVFPETQGLSARPQHAQ